MKRLYPDHYYEHPDFMAWRRKLCNARKRGIGFFLTIEQWAYIWESSGRLPERGRGADKYCMARFGDKGPYAVGNVKIITNAENWAEESRTQSLEERERRSIQMTKHWSSKRQRRLQAARTKASWVGRRTGAGVRPPFPGADGRP